jgi:hypothetical protein
MRVHVVVMRAKAVKDGSELTEIVLELLLPLIKRMNAVTSI